MIKSGILDELDHQASLICKPSFSQDIYDLDESLWELICSRKVESELVAFSDFNALALITNASKMQIKRLCSAVTLSFAPKVQVDDIKHALNMEPNCKLKYPNPELVHFVNNYWMAVKFSAFEKGVGSTSVIFGLTKDVVSLIHSCSLKNIYLLSRNLEIIFELRFSPEIIQDLIADNSQCLSRLTTNMKRIQQTFRIG